MSEHHQNCVAGKSCHRDCTAWKPPPRVSHSEVSHDGAEPVGAHVGRLQGESAPPLWERLDPAVMAALRTWDVGWPHPDGYHRYERAHHNLDRWTSDDGEAARDLDVVRAQVERARRRVVLHTNAEHRAKIVAAWVHESFPAVSEVREAAGVHGAMMGAYAGIVWGLALWMFGLDHDPLPEHVSGRILPGEPVRDVRAPFRDARAVFGAGSRGVIGGGGCAWPSDDPRPSARTRSDWLTEIYVRGTTRSASRIAGEQAVHVGLSAQLAQRRMRLTLHEQEIAVAMMDRDVTRDERVLLLRAIHLRAMGGDPDALVTAETRRLMDLRRVMLGPGSIEVCEANAAKLKAVEPIETRVAERATVDRDAYPSLLRQATADVTDAALLKAGRVVLAKVDAAVYRASSEGDALTDKPKPGKRRRVQMSDADA